MNLCSQKLHLINIECLSLHILFSHEYFALHSHQSGNCCRCYSVLPCSCLGNDPRLTHLLCKQHLSQDIVNLMCSRVVQILPFQINPGSSQIFCHMFCKIKTGWSSGILVQKVCQFPLKLRFPFVEIIRFFQFNHRIHQGFRNILPSMGAKSSF